MLRKSTIANLSLLCVLLLPHAVFAGKHENGHELIQDVHKEGTRIEFDEDQDEVYDAVQDGLIRPFSELYEAIETQLNGRVIKVELEEDDDEWIYELKLVHDNNIIKVEYNATTLEMMEIKGRNLHDVIKK